MFFKVLEKGIVHKVRLLDGFGAQRARVEVDLEIRGGASVTTQAGGGEGRALEMAVGQETTLSQEVAEELADSIEVHVRRQGSRLFGLEALEQQEVVLEVLAHREVSHDGNTHGLEFPLRADAGEQQEPGCVDGTGREDDLAGAVDHLGFSLADRRQVGGAPLKLHSDGSGPLKDDSGDVGPRGDSQSLPRGAVPAQEDAGGVLADPVADIRLGDADAVHGGTIVVLVKGPAGLGGGLDPVVRVRVALRAADGERAALAMVLRVKARDLAILRLFEIRKNALVAPASAAVPLPAVKVLPVAPNIDHGVDGGGAAKGLAPGPKSHPVVLVRVLLSLELPVKITELQLAVHERGVDQLQPRVRNRVVELTKTMYAGESQLTKVSSSPPASNRSTVTLGSSESLEAITAPAEPAPTTMSS